MQILKSLKPKTFLNDFKVRNFEVRTAENSDPIHDSESIRRLKQQLTIGFGRTKANETLVKCYY